MISKDILLLHSIKQIKRFHVAAGLCNDRSHKMSKGGKNNSDTPGCAFFFSAAVHEHSLFAANGERIGTSYVLQEGVSVTATLKNFFYPSQLVLS